MCEKAMQCDLRAAVDMRLRHVTSPWWILVLLSLTTAVADEWPVAAAWDVVPHAAAGLTHGPVLGAVTDRSVRIWLRTREPTRFEILYASRLPLDERASTVLGETFAADDMTGVVNLVGLTPNTRYYYVVRIDGKSADLRLDFNDPWPSFRTLPDEASCSDARYNPRGLFDFAFSIGCCASQDPVRSGGQYGSPPAFDTLYRRFGKEILFHIMNGDTIYEELRDGTLAGIYANYRLYWRRGRSFARFIRYMPTVFLYDDHEIGWDIHGCGEVGLGAGRWLTRDIGLAAWSAYCGWGRYPAAHRGTVRMGTALFTTGSRELRDSKGIFSELDLSTVSTLHVSPYTVGDDARSPRSQNAGVYRVERVIDASTLELDRPAEASEQITYSIGTHHYFDWRVGNCHFFALDTRGERTRPNFDDYIDPSRSILGKAQKEWLTTGVRESAADFIFIISPDPLVIYHTAYHVNPERGGVPKGDGFSSFAHEREELINTFDELERPVLVFTGDVHASASVQITDNVWELMCGPMNSTNHPIGTAGGGTMPLGGMWESQGRRVKVKWIGTFPDNVHYSRLRQPYFAIVQVNNVSRSPRPEGAGSQWVAFDAPQVVVRFHDGYSGKLVYAEGISTADVAGQTDNARKQSTAEHSTGP